MLVPLEKKRCLKKYCQCFVQGRDCYESCTCRNCHNGSGASNLRSKLGYLDDGEDSLHKVTRLWNDDESIDSSSESTSFQKLDELIECQPSSFINKVGSPKIRGLKDPEGMKYSSSVSTIPPPAIPEIFRKTASSMSHLKSIPPPAIPEVFLNAAPSRSVPPDVFTNPNFWLPWTSSSMTTSLENKESSSHKPLK